MQANVRDEVVFASPKTDAERIDLATACVRKLGIKIPALIDGIADGAEQDYTGWPDRLYVIDKDGRVTFKSQPGPFGFHPAEMEKALVKTLGGGAEAAARRED
ncbi:MAG: deiodinase [Acidobacteria bacterium]|nr:deiodinase [Acidobacteriota bacterium]